MSKRISEDIKQKIIEKIREEGLSVPKASEEFGLSRNTIYNWIGVKAEGEPSIMENSAVAKQLGERARVDVLEKLSLKQMVTKTRALYTAAINQE